MVFISEIDGILIDASDVKTSKNINFVCCDSECKDKLSFIKEHTREFIKNDKLNISTVSAHIKYKFKGNNCKIEYFLRNIGTDNALKFYRKWSEPFICESITNCFKFNKFHILYEVELFISYGNKY